jgi:hypothetical protein
MNIFRRINSDQLSRCFGTGTHRYNFIAGRILCMSITTLGEQFSLGQPFSTCFSTDADFYRSVHGGVGQLKFCRSMRSRDLKDFRTLRSR